MTDEWLVQKHRSTAAPAPAAKISGPLAPPRRLMTASRTEAAAESPQAREHSGFAPRDDCPCLHDNSRIFACSPHSDLVTAVGRPWVLFSFVKWKNHWMSCGVLMKQVWSSYSKVLCVVLCSSIAVSWVGAQHLSFVRILRVCSVVFFCDRTSPQAAILSRMLPLFQLWCKSFSFFYTLVLIWERCSINKKRMACSYDFRTI